MTAFTGAAPLSIIDGRVLLVGVVIIATLVWLAVARHHAPTRDDWADTERSPYAYTGEHDWPADESERPYDWARDTDEWRDAS